MRNLSRTKNDRKSLILLQILVRLMFNFLSHVFSKTAGAIVTPTTVSKAVFSPCLPKRILIDEFFHFGLSILYFLRFVHFGSMSWCSTFCHTCSPRLLEQSSLRQRFLREFLVLDYLKETLGRFRVFLMAQFLENGGSCIQIVEKTISNSDKIHQKFTPNGCFMPIPERKLTDNAYFVSIRTLKQNRSLSGSKKRSKPRKSQNTLRTRILRFCSQNPSAKYLTRNSLKLQVPSG